MTDKELFDLNITAPDKDIFDRAKLSWDSLAKPIDGLGIFETLVCKIAAIQGQVNPDIGKKALNVNSDIEIYGNINDEFFELLDNINFDGEIVEVSTSIMFNGLFNGNGFSINGLVLHATWSSNGFGLFSELYGTFMNVTFENCRILSSGDTYLHKYIGFITVFNYGYIADVEFINVVYLSLDDFYSQIENANIPTKYDETEGIVITSPQNFIYI